MNVPVIALIPLRCGSKGLPRKNVRQLAGKPLYMYPIDQARAAGIGRILISTDIAELLDAELGQDVNVAVRPTALAADVTPMAAVLKHVLEADIVGPAVIVLLQATSPLRDPDDIGRAIELHASGDFELVLSATRADSRVLKWGMAEGGRFLPVSNAEYCFTNRAQLPPVYRPDGAIFVFDADWFRSKGTLAGERIGMIETPEARAQDIDSACDFEAIEILLQRSTLP